MDRNVYWNAAGKPPIFPGDLNFEQWREKWRVDGHSLVADPLFVDAKNGNFQLKASSPALEIGFQPFDPKKAGRQEPLIFTKGLPEVLRAFP